MIKIPLHIHGYGHFVGGLRSARAFQSQDGQSVPQVGEELGRCLELEQGFSIPRELGANRAGLGAEKRPPTGYSLPPLWPILEASRLPAKGGMSLQHRTLVKKSPRRPAGEQAQHLSAIKAQAEVHLTTGPVLVEIQQAGRGRFLVSEPVNTTSLPSSAGRPMASRLSTISVVRSVSGTEVR